VKGFVDRVRVRLPRAIALGAGSVAVEFLRNSQVIAEAPGRPYFATALEVFASWSLMALVIVVVICACESALRPGWRRALLQGASLALATAAYAYWIGTSELLTIQYRAIGLEMGSALLMYMVWLGWAMSALLSWFFWAHEKALRAAAALRSAELARERTQQRLLESHLQVLEAQVEPRFLFDTLSRVHRLYEEDPARADQALDDLIGYLRAALPQQRERASTLGREFSLVEAYLRIVSAASHRIRRPGGALEKAYAPPMVLLPIVQLALAADPAPNGDEGVGMLAEESAERIAVRVEYKGSWARDREPQARSLRATMSLLFGTAGRLEIATAGAKTIVSVSWPASSPVEDFPLHTQPA
jgi:hypothetical protein